MKPKQFVGLVKSAASDWSEDKASRLAAALSYYTIFSLAPLLIIAIAVAGAIFGEEAARGEISGQIQNMVGETGAKAIEDMISNASKPGSGGTIATIVGILLLLWGASNVFAALQDALNTIWEVKPKPGRGWFATIKDRVLSFGMVLGIGFLLLVSLVLSAGLTAAAKFTGGFIADNPVVTQLLNIGVSFAVITLLFAMLYKYLPDVKLRWKDVWTGAIATAALFTIGKFLIGLYLGHSSVASSFGAAGSIVVLLVWIYYSVQIFFFGAEFTQVYANAYGSQMVPKENAVAMTEKDRAQQGIPTKDHVEQKVREQEGLPPKPEAPKTKAEKHGVQREPAAAVGNGNGSKHRRVEPATEATAAHLAESMAGPKVDRRVLPGMVDERLVRRLAKLSRQAARYYREARQYLEEKKSAENQGERRERM